MTRYLQKTVAAKKVSERLQAEVVKTNEILESHDVPLGQLQKACLSFKKLFVDVVGLDVLP